MRFILFCGLFLISQTVLGQSFHSQLRIETLAPIDTSLSFRGIFTVNPQTIWVSGTKSSIYFSQNSGQSWIKRQIPDTTTLDFRDIHCLSDGSVLLMSAGSSDKSRIYKSKDNGKSWKLTFSNPHPEGFLNSLTFWDNRRGIAVGDPVNQRFYILLTDDGGENWRPADVQTMPEAQPGECSFAASGTCIAVTGKAAAWLGSGGPSARIFQSKNRGGAWQTVTTPILSGKNSRGIFSVYFRNALEGIIVGGDYQKPLANLQTAALTKDGGRSWQLSVSKLPYLSAVSEIRIQQISGWIATGPSGVYASQNGLNWQSLSPRGYHCLSASADKKTLWLAGPSGKLARITASQ